MDIKKLALAIATASLLAACGGEDGNNGSNGADGADGTNGVDGTNGTDGQDLTAAPKMIRLATTPEGSELTGMFKTDNGEFFFNIQHPESSLPDSEGLAAVGAWVGVDVDTLDPMMESVAHWIA